MRSPSADCQLTVTARGRYAFATGPKEKMRASFGVLFSIIRATWYSGTSRAR